MKRVFETNGQKCRNIETGLQMKYDYFVCVYYYLVLRARSSISDGFFFSH